MHTHVHTTPKQTGLNIPRADTLGPADSTGGDTNSGVICPSVQPGREGGWLMGHSTGAEGGTDEAGHPWQVLVAHVAAFVGSMEESQPCPFFHLLRKARFCSGGGQPGCQGMWALPQS